MVRSVWVKALGALLVGTGLVCGQQPMSAPRTPLASADETITIQEPGKPEQKCRVLRSWTTPDGHLAHEVKAVSTGEVMTIVEGAPTGPAKGGAEALSTNIYHWAKDGTRPAGTPLPPIQRTQYTLPSQAAAPAPAPLVPVPAPSSNSMTRTATTEGLPVVISEQVIDDPSARPGLGSRVKNFASHLLHRDREETITVIEGSPTSGMPTITSGPTPTKPAGMPVATPAAAGSRAWPPAYAAQPAPAPTPVSTSYGDNPIMSMSPPAAGMPATKNRLVPTPAPAPGTIQQTSATTYVAAPTGTPTATAVPCPCTPCQTTSGSTTYISGPMVTQTGTPIPCSTCDPCQTCGPVIVEGPAPNDHPLRSRLSGLASLFGGSSKTTTTTTTVAPLPVITSTPPPCPPPTKVMVEAPKATDWRQSWGKLDTPKTDTANTYSAKPTAPVQPVADKKTDVVFDKPKAPIGPPVAEKKPDPLKDPETYVRRPTLDMPAPKVVEDRTVHVDVAKPTADSHTKVPLGAQSVVEAGSPTFLPVPVVTVPDYRRLPEPPPPHVPQAPELNKYVDMSNAFTNPSATPPPAMPPSASNAFSPPPTAVDPTVAAGGAFAQVPPGYPMQGAYPPGYGGPRPGMYPPPGYNPMTRGMVPQMPYGQMGPAGYAPNPAAMGQGVRPASYQVAMANPAAPAAGSANPMASAITTMRDSIYPSQREWAAGQLATADWRTHADVLHALLTGAREDPAPTVRAACVRALARMNANSTQVVSTLQTLKMDGDPRVLHEVEEALATLTPTDAGGKK
jgi:hypothetical protein